MLWLAISSPKEIEYHVTVIELLAVSIPSTIAFVGLWDKKGRIVIWCALMVAIPSILAVSALLFPFSKFAGLAYPITLIVWVIDALFSSHKHH